SRTAPRRFPGRSATRTATEEKAGFIAVGHATPAPFRRNGRTATPRLAHHCGALLAASTSEWRVVGVTFCPVDLAELGSVNSSLEVSGELFKLCHWDIAPRCLELTFNGL